MLTLEIDTTKRMLGKTQQTCRICGEKGMFDTYLVREMMQNSRDEFRYFVCGDCNCLQIESVPENLGDYYGSNYYSYQVADNPDMEFEVPVINEEKILDVGCGAGAWLLDKAKKGWGNLYGCDPFLEKERKYGDRITIRNCSIHEMEGDGTFDQIHMSDSFEHVTDPLEVLKSAWRLLKPNGLLYMSIPTYPNAAFDRYGTHWYQLDAPRHIFLHSKESLQFLSKESGMAISGIKYDSNNNQFIRSYLYQRGVPFTKTEYISDIEFIDMEYADLQGESEVLNYQKHGDHMIVYWKKSDVSLIESNRKVIFQRFTRTDKQNKPHIPVYIEPDTDYICFTNEKNVNSEIWKMVYVENMENFDDDQMLREYAVKWELKQNQIQIGPISESYEGNSIVTLTYHDRITDSELKMPSIIDDMTDSNFQEQRQKHLLQVAKQYMDCGCQDYAIQIYYQVLSESVEIKNRECMEQAFNGVMIYLLFTNDSRFLTWLQWLIDKVPLSEKNQAMYYLFGEIRAFEERHSPQIILWYYEQYMQKLQALQLPLLQSFTIDIKDYICHADSIAAYSYMKLHVKPQIISGDSRRLFQTETPVTVCGQ